MKGESKNAVGYELAGANEEAEQSTLYVYADGAKNENDQAAVEKVRQIILDLDGFKTVHLIQREENWGLAEVIDG